MLAYLPMAWIGEHIFSYCQAYCAGFCVSCPESPATALADLRELGPSYLFAPPRIFEAILTQVMIRMEDAGWLKRRLFHYFLGVARRVGPALLDRRPVGWLDRVRYRLGALFAYGPLKNALGLSRVRVAYTAGEAIGPDLFLFYRSLGINMKQLYGMTESSVFLCIQRDGAVKPDTVGPPIPGVEIKIAEDGEVLFRSPGAFLSYYKNPAATQEAKEPDGWVHTGDAGFFDADGQLTIVDRARDVGRLNSGALFAPKFIENKLEILSLHQGGGGVRRRARLRRRVHQHRPRRGRQLGRAAQPDLWLLPGVGGKRAGLRSDRGLRSPRSTATSPPSPASPPRRSAGS